MIVAFDCCQRRSVHWDVFCEVSPTNRNVLRPEGDGRRANLRGCGTQAEPGGGPGTRGTRHARGVCLGEQRRKWVVLAGARLLRQATQEHALPDAEVLQHIAVAPGTVHGRKLQAGGGHRE